MKTLDEIKSIIKDHKAEFADKYGVSEIGVFGSVVRGEAREDSDVDVLVEFNRSIGLFAFIDLEFRLQDLIGAKVDLVHKSGLKKFIGQHVLREVQYV